MFTFDTPKERRGSLSLKWDSIAPRMFPMWVADMDFPAPPPVLKALREKVEHGIFGYGMAGDLPAVFCKWLRGEFRVSVEESWIVPLPAIVAALRAASHLRDGPVLVNTPNYNGLLGAPLKAGKRTRLSPLLNNGEFYRMNFADMRKRAAGCGLFFLCNPHNPVGRVYTRDELLELSLFAKKNKLVVISDEVHCGLVFDRPHIPWFSVDEYARDKSITLIGPAKTFNIPGLPLGFAIIPGEKLRKEFKKICYALPEPGVFSVTAALAAYSACGEWKTALVDYLRANRDYLESRLRNSFPAARFTRVEGTYLQWADFRPLGIADPCRWLKDKAEIIASPGEIFGKAGYVRLNFGTSLARLKDALDRIERSAPGNGRPGTSTLKGEGA